jgi:putative transposase
MKYDPSNQHRRSIRLKGYVYSQPGYYFVTICTQHRHCLFGTISKGIITLNDIGMIVHKMLLDLPSYDPTVHIDCHIVMPNHIHTIIQFCRTDEEKGGTGRGGVTPPEPNTASIE